MMKKTIILACCMIVLAAFAAVASGADPRAFSNYSADMETTTPQGSFTSKVSYKDAKMRMERTARGQASVNITRPDKKVIWMLMPDARTYMEIPLDTTMQDIQSQVHDPNIKTEKEFISHDVVDRHPAKKYRLTVTTDGKKERSGYIWEATDLNNFPIKYESEDKKITTVWRNIKAGGVPDSAFEIPPGYTKMDMPAMPGMGEPRKQRK